VECRVGGSDHIDIASCGCLQVVHALIKLLPLQAVFVAVNNLPSRVDPISTILKILPLCLNKDNMCMETSCSAETLKKLPYLGPEIIMRCPSLTETEATNVFVCNALPRRIPSSLTPDKSEVVETCVLRKVESLTNGKVAKVVIVKHDLHRECAHHVFEDAGLGGRRGSPPRINPAMRYHLRLSVLPYHVSIYYIVED
jgi:hypothetical protein